MAGENVESADSVRARIAAKGQGHVFRFWDRLSEVEREALIEDLRQVPEDFPESVLAPAPAPEPPEPPEVIPAAGSAEERRRATEARALGSHTLATGAIAAVMLAGGEGTRLGHAGPKGTLPIGPATGKTLYRWFAEQVRIRSRKAGRPIPLIVLTSPSTHVATVEHFRAGGNFGLEGSQVRFVPQRTLPVLDKDGRFVLRSMSALTKAPDGHGGLLAALKRAGLLAEFRIRGVYHLFVFQVDNPLVKVLDPETIGRHLISGAQATSRVVEKLRPDEPHGVFCRRGGRLHVLEYTEITKEQAERRDPDGKLSFRAANIAVHLFRCDFLGQLASDAEALPWHVAEKPARAADSDGRADAVEIAARRAERFLFDVLARADRTLLLDGARDEWFAPVKSSFGEFTADAARAAISRQHARWLRAAGVPVPSVPAGEGGAPPGPVEVSPLLATDGDELRAKFGELRERLPRPAPGAFPISLEEPPPAPRKQVPFGRGKAAEAVPAPAPARPSPGVVSSPEAAGTGSPAPGGGTT